MKLSIKLLLLLTALAASVIAWVNVRSDFLSSTRTSLRNSGDQPIYIAEADGGTSVIYVDASGAVATAQLDGPAGYKELDDRAGSYDELDAIKRRLPNCNVIDAGPSSTKLKLP